MGRRIMMHRLGKNPYRFRWAACMLGNAFAIKKPYRKTLITPPNLPLERGGGGEPPRVVGPVLVVLNSVENLVKVRPVCSGSKPVSLLTKPVLSAVEGEGLGEVILIFRFSCFLNPEGSRLMQRSLSQRGRGEAFSLRLAISVPMRSLHRPL